MDVNLVRVIILCEVCNANVPSNYIRLKNGLKSTRVHLLCGKLHKRNPSNLALLNMRSSILKNAQYVKPLSSYVNNAERYCNIFNVYRFAYFFSQTNGVFHCLSSTADKGKSIDSGRHIKQ